jgi:Short C-terminal domain
VPPTSYAPPVTFPSTSTPPPPAAPPSAPADPAEALRQLDDLRAKNLITDEEYQAKRKAILDQM